MRMISLATITMITLLGSFAAAQAALAAEAGTHEHDGFFLRFQAGPGYTRLRTPSIEVSGGGFGFTFALGGRVARNLLLYGEMNRSTADEPDVKLRSGLTTSLKDTSSSILGIGIGLAYYLPANVYLSGSASLSQISFADMDGKEVADTKYGPGVVLSVGKDWWVSANWGLGVAALVYGTQAKDRDPDLPGLQAETWRAVGVALAMSATFN